MTNVTRKQMDVDEIFQHAMIVSDYSSRTIDDMIMTIHDNPKISSYDIERLIESAQNILEAFYD